MLINTNAAQLVVSLAGDQSRAAFVQPWRIQDMRKAEWREALDHDAEFARRERDAATRAAGVVPCAECGTPATVSLASRAMRWSIVACDPCAEHRLKYAANVRADVTLSQLVGVPLVTTIEVLRPMTPAEPLECDRCEGFGRTIGSDDDCTLCDGTGVIPDAFVKDDTPDRIDVAQFVVDVLNGAVGDVMVPAAPTAVQARELVISVLESRLRRTLSPSERLGVERAATDEAVRRYHQRRADLAETQQRLALMPGARMFA